MRVQFVDGRDDEYGENYNDCREQNTKDKTIEHLLAVKVPGATITTARIRR